MLRRGSAGCGFNKEEERSLCVTKVDQSRLGEEGSEQQLLHLGKGQGG